MVERGLTFLKLNSSLRPMHAAHLTTQLVVSLINMIPLKDAPGIGFVILLNLFASQVGWVIFLAHRRLPRELTLDSQQNSPDVFIYEALFLVPTHLLVLCRSVAKVDSNSNFSSFSNITG